MHRRPNNLCYFFDEGPICCFPMSILLWKSASMEFVSLVTLEDLCYIFPDAIQLLIRYNVHNNICQIDLNLILSTNLNSDYSTFEVQIKSQARCKNIYITTSCYYSYPTATRNHKPNYPKNPSTSLSSYSSVCNSNMW